MAFAGARSAKQHTPSQLTPQRLQPNRPMVEGCSGLLQGRLRGLALMHSTAFVTSCRPPVPSAGMRIGAGFRILRAGRAGRAQTDSWGSITAVPSALQSPPCSQRTAPVPPVTTPFFFHFSHKQKKILPPELPSWPLCLRPTVPALSLVTSSQLAAGHPQHRALELHYHSRAGAAHPGCPGELP